MLRRFLAGAATTRPPAAALWWIASGRRGGSGEAESVAYRMSMLRAPSVVPKRELPRKGRNSCSLIGRLSAPVRPQDFSSDEDPRAYTFLSVSPSSSAPPSSSSGFKVTLDLKGELASVSLKHLKQNDLVYVSGSLDSYHKVKSSGERDIMYKIFVNELNYVLDQSKRPQSSADLDQSKRPKSAADLLDPSLKSTTLVTSQMQKENEYIDRLRLWQVFFASPCEWWDNRESKPYVNYPDFKHKSTREKIWLHPDDPPWVRKQLELHDLKITENGHKGRCPSKNHDWKDQDFDYSDDDDDEVQRPAEA